MSETPETSIQVSTPSAGHDTLLEIFASLSEKCSFGITLFVGGQMIAGDTISFSEYITTSLSNFGTAVEQMSGGGFGDQIRTMAHQMAESVGGEEYRPNYIHLKNVTYNTNTPLVNGLLRIRLSSVDGFMLGRTTRLG